MTTKIEDENERVKRGIFMDGIRQIRERRSDLAGKKGELAGIYKRLSDFGFPKADVDWAIGLQDKDSPKVIAEMRRRITLAGYLGHELARQLSMFDTDRTPIEDVAFESGFSVGMLRGAMQNPHDLSTVAGQAWQRGFNEGTAEINRSLAEAVKMPAPAAAGDRGNKLSRLAASESDPAPIPDAQGEVTQGVDEEIAANGAEDDPLAPPAPPKAAGRPKAASGAALN